MTFWGWTAAAVFAALGVFFLTLLVRAKAYGIEERRGDLTYFSGHHEFSAAKSGFLSVRDGKLVFTPAHGAVPYFSVPLDRVVAADAERHVAGLLGYAQVGPGAALGSNHFLLVRYRGPEGERKLRFASRVGSAGTIELRDRILSARAAGG